MGLGDASMSVMSSVCALPGWNPNIHYGLELLGSIPEGVTDALDVGCGEGWLVRELSRRVPHVVGIDPDEASIWAARGRVGVRSIEFVQGDFLTYPFPSSSFDLITCIAALHHMDEAAALRRMAEILRPGGVLAIVGIGRSRLPLDIAWEVAGAVSTRVHKLTKPYWETPAPKIWPPPHSYAELRTFTQSILPGRRFRRRILWRYVLTWTKPRT